MVLFRNKLLDVFYELCEPIELSAVTDADHAGVRALFDTLNLAALQMLSTAMTPARLMLWSTKPRAPCELDLARIGEDRLALALD
jgi:hypothetical protein